MNIAFVNSTKIWSGVKTWMVEFGIELEKKGHRVFFFGCDPVFAEETRKKGCSTFEVKFGPDYNPLAIAYFMKHFRRFKIDITCMNIQKELRTAGIAAKILSIPVVHRVGLPGDINYKPDQILSQKLIVDNILVTSRWIKDEINQRFRFIPNDKIHLIYNSKPVNGIVRTSISRPTRFVITSRLAEGKGHLTLIKAFQLVHDRGIEDFHCDIYGDGPMRETIFKAIKIAGLEAKLELRGFKTDMKNRLEPYHFGLLASKEESFPNTVAEYMSAGLPCIATDGGGTSEMIRHGKNGFLYVYQNAQQLANYLVSCLEMDDNTYAILSKQAKKTMQESFELQANVQKLADWFQELIAGKSHSRNSQSKRSTDSS